MIPKIEHLRKYRDELYARSHVPELIFIKERIVRHHARRHCFFWLCLVFDAQNGNVELEFVAIVLEYVAIFMDILVFGVRNVLCWCFI